MYDETISYRGSLCRGGRAQLTALSQLPGFRILAANEIEKDIAAAYSLNHPGVKMLNCDIADLTKERLAGALAGKYCGYCGRRPTRQSYSTLGKRRMDDRANLFLQYKRILQIL